MSKKILVIDDEASVCSMLKKFLEMKGYAADIAVSGQEGIDRVRQNAPAIVLLDIRMPGMDGVEVLKEIKRIDKNVNVIMITAVNENEIGKKCIELGAYDYIIKPFDLEYLENALLVKLFDIND
ncbi:MAG: response regulator [Candidatus Omnitrophica bacterium]|nr:response regulator [Candidatus Omnitrophota bacterium]